MSNLSCIIFLAGFAALPMLFSPAAGASPPAEENLPVIVDHLQKQGVLSLEIPVDSVEALVGQLLIQGYLVLPADPRGCIETSKGWADDSTQTRGTNCDRVPVDIFGVTVYVWRCCPTDPTRPCTQQIQNVCLGDQCVAP